MIVGPNTLEEMDMDGSLDSVQVRSQDELEKLRKVAGSRQLPGRQEQMDHLQQRLEEALTALTEVLSPVLSPEGPREVLAGDTDPEPRTELAAWMQHTSHRLELHVNYVRALVDRVDL